jgi:hypothetical protein
MRARAWIRSLICFCVGLAVTGSSAAQSGSVRRAEGVVALIGGSAPGAGVSIVLESDVSFEARLRLAGRSHAELPLGPLPAPLLRATLDEIVGQVLIAREAERVRVSPPTSRDVARQEMKLAELAGGRSRLSSLMRELGVAREELTAIARRRAAVQRFLRANLEGAAVVTEEEVERAYEAGDHPFIGQSFEEVREAMRVILVRRALDRAVARWVSILKQRTPLRLLASYASST